MKFELTYNHIHFLIEITPESHQFNSYELYITSSLKNKQLKHFQSGVKLDSNPMEIMDELHDYLDQEEIIVDICKQWEIYFEKVGPSWKK